MVRLTPAEEKALDYKKQRVNVGLHPHQDRRALPLKKALRRQTYRRLVDRAIRKALETSENPEDVSPAPVFRRKSMRFGIGNIPLGERVQDRRRIRQYRLGWNFFKRGYSSEEHRAAFSAFLIALTQGRGPGQKPAAEL